MVHAYIKVLCLLHGRMVLELLLILLHVAGRDGISPDHRRHIYAVTIGLREWLLVSADSLVVLIEIIHISDVT